MQKLIILMSILIACNSPAPDKVYCSGFVIRETVLTPDGEQVSRSFTLKCNGQCPDRKPCEILKKEYNPARPNGLIKEEWCGCSGDSIPQGCDVVLRTFNIGGNIIQQADCTPFNTCPVATDSCIQVPDKNVKTDTIRTAAGLDSLIKFTGTITCDCVART